VTQELRIERGLYISSSSYQSHKRYGGLRSPEGGYNRWVALRIRLAHLPIHLRFTCVIIIIPRVTTQILPRYIDRLALVNRPILRR